MFRAVSCSLRFWCILETGDRLQDDCHNDCGADAMIFPVAADQQVFEARFLEGRPGADQLPMAGQGLSMNGNGRLTAPPEVEVALVTNSVDGMVLEGGMARPTTRGTTLASFSPGIGTRTREEREDLRAGAARLSRRGVAGLQGFGKFDPVSATQGLSVPREVAAGS